MRRLVPAAMVGLVLGALVGACAPRSTGPTAVVLKVLLNEGLGSHILYISGVDDTPVNVFPSVFRPEQVSATHLRTGETVRVLLDDALAGTPITFGVVGFDAVGLPLEAGSVRVTPVLQQEVTELVRLSLYVDPADGRDGGWPWPDAGSCACPTGCCGPDGTCAAPVELGGRLPMRAVPAGDAGVTCLGLCDPLKSDGWRGDLGLCRCGAGAACAPGQRCSGGSCVCDVNSRCEGCCQGQQCVATISGASTCGAGGFTCKGCGDKGCTLGVCEVCKENASDKCCTEDSTKDTNFPTCRGVTGACEACDLARSDRCLQRSTGRSACVCGPAQQTCAAWELCLPADGGVMACVAGPVVP